LLEDIAVPVERLLATCRELTELFDRHGCTASVIFGHAKDGNIHFLINENFDRPDLVRRYLSFTADLVDLVLGSGGTLKAEHGTGRIMAPFVRRQYGDELYEVMCEVKRLLDPQALLNPGVLLKDLLLTEWRFEALRGDGAYPPRVSGSRRESWAGISHFRAGAFDQPGIPHDGARRTSDHQARCALIPAWCPAEDRRVGPTPRACVSPLTLRRDGAACVTAATFHARRTRHASPGRRDHGSFEGASFDDISTSRPRGAARECRRRVWVLRETGDLVPHLGPVKAANKYRPSLADPDRLGVDEVLAGGHHRLNLDRTTHAAKLLCGEATRSLRWLLDEPLVVERL
jgi:hypothetical protein